MSEAPAGAPVKPARKAKPADPLDALVQGDPLNVIALMLWKNRMREPDLYVRIDEADIKGLEDCVRYLKVTPQVQILRPAGAPAQAAVAASGNRRAVPAREASAPRPYVIVRLVDRGTENRIQPIENNEQDYAAQQQAAQVKRARDQAERLAARILQGAASGESSLSDIQDAAEALVVLARAT